MGRDSRVSLAASAFVRGLVICGLTLTVPSGCSGEGTAPQPGLSPPAPPPPPPPSPPPPPAPTGDAIVVDVNTRYQTMQGFGVAVRVPSDPHLIGRFGGQENSLQMPSAAEAEIMNELFVELGLTRARMSLQHPPTFTPPYRTEWTYSDAHIDFVQKARTRGMTTWWFAPSTGVGTLGTPQQYADWAMTVLRYWRAQGLAFPYWSILNEPYTGGPVSAEWVRDATKSLGAKLRAEGHTTKLVIPDGLNPANAVTVGRVVLEDAEARQYVGVLSFHMYASPADFYGVSAVRALAEQYGLPLWMSEYSTTEGRLSPLEYGVLMHRLFVEHNVVAHDYMWGFFGDFDVSQLISVQSTGLTYNGYTIRPEYHVVGQWSKYVKPGAVRVRATSANASLLVSAFRNPSGKLAVIVINIGGAPASVTLPAGVWRCYVGPANCTTVFQPKTIQTYVEQ